MNYDTIKQYAKATTIGLLAYSMAGCGFKLNFQPKVNDRYITVMGVGSMKFGPGVEEPIQVAANTLENKVMTDAPTSYNNKTAKTDDRPFYMNPWVITGAVVVVIGGVVGAVASQKPADNPPPPPAAQPTTVPTVAPTPTPCTGPPESNPCQ